MGGAEKLVPPLGTENFSEFEIEMGLMSVIARFRQLREDKLCYWRGEGLAGVSSCVSIGRRFLRHALELGVPAIIEVKDKYLRRPRLGLEAALVGRGRGVEVVRAFGEILLLLLVIFA